MSKMRNKKRRGTAPASAQRMGKNHQDTLKQNQDDANTLIKECHNLLTEVISKTSVIRNQHHLKLFLGKIVGKIVFI